MAMQRPSALSAPLGSPSFMYAFSLSGNIRSLEIGSNPVGKLIDIDYVDVLASTRRKNKQIDPPQGIKAMNGGWEGLEGRVVAGSDWATARTDGVIEFNGRLTLRTNEKKLAESKAAAPTPPAAAAPEEEDDDDDSLLINLFVSGVVDSVVNIGDPTEDRTARIIKLHALPARPPLPIALAVRFELAQATEPWLAKELPQTRFEKYAQLVQSPFVACGFVQFRPGEQVPSSIEVDILQVTPALPPASTSARASGQHEAL